MNRENVVSSELRSVGYSEQERVLEAEFCGGGIYQYFGVSPEVYRGLLAADSKGRFFNYWIRDKYSYQRIS